MEIEDASVATWPWSEAMIAPLREVQHRPLRRGQLTAQGNILDHEYEIESGGAKVAEVSRRWFRVRDTYGVQIAGPDTVLLLAVAVCMIRSWPRLATRSRQWQFKDTVLGPGHLPAAGSGCARRT